ncbi:MAG: DUF4065 domain-containing protein [Muribaculaceae bacterium]|nr:DUF4065 domain-containing protein [Muribaculaceae bacterium]
MEKYVDMKSPFTGGKVKEISTKEIKEFRKEKFTVHVRYYMCEDTGEQFTTTEQDTLQFNDLYAQYRLMHGIPFPDEIREIRMRYGLNYSQISKILGFGANQYAKYEAGEVPSESNGKMIAAIKDKDVLLDMLRRCKPIFQLSEYDRILTSILKSEVRDDENPTLFQIVYRDSRRDLFNGFGRKSMPKLFEFVSYVVKKHGEIFPTKLNKLMFYSDFYNYRKLGQSISGLQYRALNFGPAPDHYATIYDNVPGLEKRYIEAHGMNSTIFSFNEGIEVQYLSKSEIESIESVIAQLKNLSVAEIIQASHEENGWLNNKITHGLIPYDEAFELKLV